MDRRTRPVSPAQEERKRRQQKRAKREPRVTPKQRVRILRRYLAMVEEGEVEVDGRIESWKEDPMAQAFECDRCHTFHRGEPYFVSMADQQVATTLDWEICEECKEEVETLLHRKEEKKQKQT